MKSSLQATFRSLIPRDDRGSAAASGLFAGVIAAGAMLYIVELGASAIEGVEMQNAANSGAMAGATSLARVLNTVALINVTLVSLVSIVSGIKSIEALVVLAIMICAAICALPYCWGCWACPYQAPLNTAQQYVARVIDAIENPIQTVVQAANEVIQRFDVGFLIVAHELARIAMAGQLKEVLVGAAVGAAVGYVFQFIPDMPFMKNPCAYLCDMGGVSGGDEGWLPSWWPIRIFTSVAMAVYSGDFAGTMCGGGGGANCAKVESADTHDPMWQQTASPATRQDLELAAETEGIAFTAGEEEAEPISSGG